MMLQALRSRPGALRLLVAVAGGVLALHLALLSSWTGKAAVPLGRAGPGPARPVVHLLPQAGSGQARPAVSDPRPGPPDTSTAPGLTPQATAAPGAQPQDLAPLPAAPRLPMDPAAGRGLPSPGAPAQAGEPIARQEAGADEPADAAGVGAAPVAADAQPPPLYPALLPAAASLRYALHYYGRSGEAVLSWRPAGASYELRLQGLPVFGPEGNPAPLRPGRADARLPRPPLIEQASQGLLGANGLAPERFTDRRRGRGQRAANFRRELGRIEFSGSATAQPAWPGAQDRLSWWVQLPAIVAAAATLPAEIGLFVVDARGRGELWRFQYQGGGAAVQHWRHEPADAEGQRVELWLDPAQGHWPVQLRLTSLRTGERFELQLLAIDPTPP